MTHYTEELIKVLKCSEKESINLNHPYIGTEHFILGVLSTKNDISKVLTSYNITYNKMYAEIAKIHNKTYNENTISYSPLLKKILNINKKEITLKDAFISMLNNSEGIALSLFINSGINIDELYNEINNNYSFDNFGIVLNDLVSNKEITEIYEREKEIEKIINILCRKNKCNPLLIGEAGVGKTAIVEGLAYKIVNNDIPNSLKNKTIVSISLPNIVSGTKYRGEFEEKIDKLLKKITNNNNIILFIDEIHTLVGAGAADGAIDASNILKPYLARNKIKCIGSTTIQEYNKSIKKDKALDRRFNKIIINEPDTSSIKKIIYNIAPLYEKYHCVKINKNCLNYIINISKTIYPNKYEPDRTIDLLDEVCSSISINNDKKELYITKDNLYFEKEKSLTNKNYNEAIRINKEINIINKKIDSYKPTITIRYINNLFNKNQISKIGF